VLAIMAEAWALEPALGSRAVAAKLMSDARLWGADLTQVGSLAADALAGFEAIERRGVRAALDDRLSSAGA